MDKVRKPSNSEYDTQSPEPLECNLINCVLLFVDYNLLLLLQICEFLHILLRANSEVKNSVTAQQCESSRIETTQSEQVPGGR
jgi:hypothetical protein